MVYSDVVVYDVVQRYVVGSAANLWLGKWRTELQFCD